MFLGMDCLLYIPIPESKLNIIIIISKEKKYHIPKKNYL